MKVQTTVTLSSGCEAVASAEITAEPPRSAYEYDVASVLALCQCCGREFDLTGDDEDIIVAALVKAANEQAESDWYERGEWQRSQQLESRL